MSESTDNRDPHGKAMDKENKEQEMAPWHEARHEVHRKLENITSTLNEHQIRLSVLEKNLTFFQSSILERFNRMERVYEEANTSMKGLHAELAALPERMSQRVVMCKQELEADLHSHEIHADERYATKSEVITPAGLRNILLIVTTVAAALFAGVKFIHDEISKSDDHDQGDRKRLESLMLQNTEDIKSLLKKHEEAARRRERLP